MAASPGEEIQLILPEQPAKAGNLFGVRVGAKQPSLANATFSGRGERYSHRRVERRALL